jgi:transcriptional regulator with XRE-family HTH domain
MCLKNWEGIDNTMITEANIIGKKIRQIRERLGMTQAEFADRLEIKRTTYANYETGYTAPTLYYFVKVRELFGVDLNWLIAGDEDVPDTLEIRDTGVQYAPQINSVLLENILMRTDLSSEERFLKLSPRQKARITAMVYEIYANRREGDPGSQISKILELINGTV